MKIKKGDKVKIMTGGKDIKGKEGTVINVSGKKNKVIVEGLNLVKKHRKPSQANPDGAIIEIEAAIDASNVMVIDPKTKQPTRVGYIFEGDKKVRIAKKSGTKLD